jgi:hypothetical protein
MILLHCELHQNQVKSGQASGKFVDGKANTCCPIVTSPYLIVKIQMEMPLEKLLTVLLQRLIQSFLHVHDASSSKFYLLGICQRHFHRKYLTNTAVQKKNLQNKPYDH